MSSLSIPINEDFIEAVAARVVELLADTHDPESGAVEAGAAWLNVKHAARHLDCPVSRIYDLVALKELVPEKDGRRLLFRRSDLDAYVRGNDRRAKRSRRSKDAG
jgi:excisionase family DNA binding protein